MNFLAAGYKLIRSYKTDANEKDKLNDITHLVFLVHGIGHKIDNKKIIKNTSQYVYLTILHTIK